MSKADTLGGSGAFKQARTARSARRTVMEETIGGGGTQSEPTSLPLSLISDNPDNPRDHLRNLDETVANVREVGVLVPLVVARVEAYLHTRPERAGELMPGATYLVVDGHRRLEAARRAGFATVAVHVDDDRVSTDEALLEAAFVANYHRDDMTDLEEAHALKALVEHYGSQTKAAKRLGIPQGTISTKLSLLKLAPELQRDLVEGTRTVEQVRNLGKLSPEEQKAKADERAAVERARKQPAPAPAAAEPAVDETADYHAVIIPEPPASSTPPPERPSHAAATAEPRPTAQPESKPAVPTQDRSPWLTTPPTLAGGDNQTAALEGIAWGDPAAVRELLMEWMDDEPRRRLVEMMADEMAGQHS